jgi:hypothetical protein
MPRSIDRIRGVAGTLDGTEPIFTNGPIRSLIVRDVDRLTRTDQERLIEWLNRHDRDTRVITRVGRAQPSTGSGHGAAHTI